MIQKENLGVFKSPMISSERKVAEDELRRSEQCIEHEIGEIFPIVY